MSETESSDSASEETKAVIEKMSKMSTKFPYPSREQMLQTTGLVSSTENKSLDDDLYTTKSVGRARAITDLKAVKMGGGSRLVITASSSGDESEWKKIEDEMAAQRLARRKDRADQGPPSPVDDERK
jgi:hypothetical protein